ncbi:hypothetical protein LINPERHAP2_LOCUS16053 [Linum perenne]
MARYFVTSVWQSIRSKQAYIVWDELIWRSPNIHKHSMMVWLAVKRKLITREIILLPL